MRRKRQLVLVALVAAWVAFVVALVVQRDREERFSSPAPGACAHDTEATVHIPAVPPSAVHLGFPELMRHAREDGVDLKEPREVVIAGHSVAQLLLRGLRTIDGRSNTWVEGKVELHGTFARSVRLRRLYFTGGLEADGATFAQGLRIVDSKFAEADIGSSVLSINHATVYAYLDLRRNKFAGNVDLSRVHVNGNVSLGGVVFLGDAFGALDASNMVITGSVEAHRECFLPADQLQGVALITWQNTTIGGSAIFDESDFRPPADFSNMSVHHVLSFAGAHVLAGSCDNDADKDKCGVIFNDLQVDGLTNFDGSVLRGCLAWNRASFGGLDFDIQVEKVCKDDVWLSADAMSYKSVLSPRGIYGMTRFLRTALETAALNVAPLLDEQDRDQVAKDLRSVNEIIHGVVCTEATGDPRGHIEQLRRAHGLVLRIIEGLRR